MAAAQHKVNPPIALVRRRPTSHRPSVFDTGQLRSIYAATYFYLCNERNSHLALFFTFFSFHFTDTNASTTTQQPRPPQATSTKHFLIACCNAIILQPIPLQAGTDRGGG